MGIPLYRVVMLDETEYEKLTHEETLALISGENETKWASVHPMGYAEDATNPECCRRSFAASIKDTAKRLLEDPTVAPRAVHNERMAICEGCDRFRSESQTCEICGCYMPLKTTMANLKCPIDKWSEWHRGN